MAIEIVSDLLFCFVLQILFSSREFLDYRLSLVVCGCVCVYVCMCSMETIYIRSSGSRYFFFVSLKFSGYCGEDCGQFINMVTIIMVIYWQSNSILIFTANFSILKKQQQKKWWWKRKTQLSKYIYFLLLDHHRKIDKQNR